MSKDIISLKLDRVIELLENLPKTFINIAKQEQVKAREEVMSQMWDSTVLVKKNKQI
jgi:hypothetical protein